MEKPLISIVIPVYNVESYLEQCVETVIGQVYENIEIILIDDGSTDNSGKICDELVKKDKRIKVIHKKNGGLSDARNYGLDIAKGEYISFIDSDDYVEKTYINELYESILAKKADIAVGEYYVVSNRNKKIETNIRMIEKEYTNIEGVLDLLYQKNMTSSACAKLYKKELFDDVRFPLHKLHEDVPVVYKLFLKSKKIVYINNKLYYYYQREGSIVNSTFRKEKLDYIEHTKIIVDEMKLKEKKLYQAAISRHISACFQILFNIPFKLLFKTEGNYVWNEILKYRYSILKDQDVRAMNKCACVLSYFGRGFIWLVGNLVF